MLAPIPSPPLSITKSPPPPSNHFLQNGADFGDDDKVAVPTAPQNESRSGTPLHRRQLFFHGDKNALVVDRSMAFKWVEPWKEILQIRDEFVYVGREEWIRLTPTQKLASLLSDRLLDEYDELLAPYGYSIRNPDKILPQTAF